MSPRIRVYLSARTTEAERLQGWRDDELRDYAVTSRWIDEAVNQPMTLELAERDYWDVKDADALILYNPEGSAFLGHGGRHVEFGLALAWGKQVVIVGPRTNVFHHYIRVHCVQTIEEAAMLLGYLEDERAVLAPWNSDR